MIFSSSSSSPLLWVQGAGAADSGGAPSHPFFCFCWGLAQATAGDTEAADERRRASDRFDAAWISLRLFSLDDYNGLVPNFD